MSNSIDIAQIKTALYEKLQQSGWSTILKTFIMGDEFDRVIRALAEDVNNGYRFTPKLAQLFRAFEECPYSELKVVIIGQDPYPQIGVADGISFSCSNTGKIEASLRYIFDEIQRTVYPREGYVRDPDLKRWSNQGILMLNTALTTRVSKIGQHYHIWEPFTTFLFDMLNHRNPGLIYVFLGKKAEFWKDHVSSVTATKIFCSHPASAVYAKKNVWDSGDMFNKVSDLVLGINGTKIIW